jgi:hypothetical protein
MLFVAHGPQPHYQRLSLYYETPDLVNCGADKDDRDDVEKELLAARERERAPADGNDQKVLRADKYAPGDPDNREKIIESQ